MAKYMRLMWNHSHGNASIDGWSEVILIIIISSSSIVNVA